MKNIITAIGIIGFFILLIVVYNTFKNNLEESAYEIINKNLWLGIPLVIIGYVLFEIIKRRFGKQLYDSVSGSDYLKDKMIQD